jgi:hypothetical protein
VVRDGAVVDVLERDRARRNHRVGCSGVHGRGSEKQGGRAR